MTTEHARYFHLGADAPELVECDIVPELHKLLMWKSIYVGTHCVVIDFDDYDEGWRIKKLLISIRDGI